MNSCCKLGNEYQLKKNVLDESENFFVVPAIGQMNIEGYVLLCSKKHSLGMGDIPQNHTAELETILDKTKQIISNTYNSDILIFEHGPKLRCHKGGGCLDHSHLHIVPTSVDIMKFLQKIFKPEKIQNLNRLREIYEAQKSSYMFIETQDNTRYVIEVEFPIPSQYIRQIIASKMNITAWDWRINPDYDTFEKTIDTLKNKF
jgi:ATP adenylyltransferase